MARVPIIAVGSTLIATVQEDLRDRDAVDLQTALGRTLEETGARSVLIDVSIVETVDSFLGRILGEVAALARLLGAQTAVVGIQPAVAITLVELGLELKGVATARNVEQGLALLARRERAEEMTARRAATSMSPALALRPQSRRIAVHGPQLTARNGARDRS